MIKRIVLCLAILLGVVGLSVFASDPAFAETAKEAVCSGIGAAEGDGDNCEGGGGYLTGLVRNVLNIFSVIIGIVAVVMIMVAGFNYVTAGGEQSKIGSAKQTLTYAIIGLVIAALAQVIVRFVLESLN